MNIKYATLIALIALNGGTARSEEVVVLKSGKKIKILDDRTWIDVDTISKVKQNKQLFDSALFASMVDVKIDRFNNSEVYRPKETFKTPDEIELYPMVFCIMNSCKINFKIISSSKTGWRFLEFRNLVGLCDGERFEFDEPSHRGNVGRGYVLEQMSVKLPELSLQKLANCKSLELKLGIHEFAVPLKSRESWRQISNRFEQER